MNETEESEIQFPAEQVSARESYREKMERIGIKTYDELRNSMYQKGKTNELLPQFQEYCYRNELYQVPNQEFALALAKHLKGKKVLEIGAGTGMLVASLRTCGIDVIATDNFSTVHGELREWMKKNGNPYQVEELDYKKALKKYGEKVDVVICSWMPPGENWMPEILEADPEQIIAIGEIGRQGTYGTGDLIKGEGEEEWVKYPGRTIKRLEDVEKYSLCYTDFDLIGWSGSGGGVVTITKERE